ncbi:MAG: hypothetical protein AB8H03_02000 [Saprospiraceae bacterium]
MENLIKFIKIDVVVQMALLGLAVMTGIFLMPLMITLPILGGWQLLSASIIWWRLRDQIRIRYLFFSIAYLILMFLSVYLENPYQRDIYEFLIGLIFIPIPFGIAIWYLNTTQNTLKGLEKLKIVEMPETMENILDNEEIFKIAERL